MRAINRPLWLRSLAARPFVVVLVVLSAAAVATSVVGPLLSRAVHDSTLQSAVAVAGPAGTAVAVTSEVSGDDDLDQVVELTEVALGSAAGAAAETLWQPVHTDVESALKFIWTPRSSASTGSLSSRAMAVVASGCGGYVLVAGSCPEDERDVGVSSQDARRAGIGVGSLLDLSSPGKRLLRVAMLYDANASSTVPLARPSTPAGLAAGVNADPLLMASTEDLLVLSNGSVRVRSQLSLSSTIRLANLPEVRRVLAATERNLLAPEAVLRLDTRLPALLDEVERQVAAAQVLIWVSVAQAVALALFAWAVVMQRIGRARAGEWGIGRLRGIPRHRWLRTIYAGPGAALAAGLPLGLLAGAALAQRAVDDNLAVTVPVEVWRWPVLAAAGAAVLGAGATLLVVGVRSARRPLADLLTQASEPRRLGVAGAVGQAAIVVLGVVTCYQLVSGGVLSTGGSILGFLAPALLALALSVICVRLLVVAVRRATQRPARSLAALVVGRQAARAPSALNPAMAVAAGVALTLFATQVYALSMRNQALRADALVGAGTVLRVDAPPSVDLVTAVRRADPTGRFAMAAEERPGTLSGGVTRLLAVDSSRLAAVSAWSPAWAGVADVAATLRPDTAPVIEVRGRRAELTLDRVKIETSFTDALGVQVALPPGGLGPPSLLLTVETSGRWRTVDFGPVRASGRYRAALPCPAGCRLVQLGLRSVAGVAYRASFTITGFRTDQQAASTAADWLQSPGRWREQVGNRVSTDPAATAIPLSTPAGLEVTASDVQGDNLTMVASADTVDVPPAILGAATPADAFPGVQNAVVGSGLDDNPQLLGVAGRAAALPRFLDDGVLVDLVNLQGLSDPASRKSVSQVWLAAGAPASVEQTLSAAGVLIQSRESLPPRQVELQQGATTRGAALARWIGYAALLLTLVMLLVSRLADATRRRADWLSLRAAGLPVGTVRWLATAEIAAPALVGALLGVIAGLVAIRLAAPQLPLVDVGVPTPPLDLTVAWTPVVVLGLATAAAIAAVAMVGGWWETRKHRERP